MLDFLLLIVVKECLKKYERNVSKTISWVFMYICLRCGSNVQYGYVLKGLTWISSMNFVGF